MEEFLLLPLFSFFLFIIQTHNYKDDGLFFSFFETTVQNSGMMRLHAHLVSIGIVWCTSVRNTTWRLLLCSFVNLSSESGA